MEHKFRIANLIGTQEGYQATLEIIADCRDFREAFIAGMEVVESDSPYECIIRKVKEKRSLSANAYLWVLCDKIANEISTKEEKPVSKEDVYRQAIHNVGSFDVVTLKADAVDTFIKHWKNNGTGWICEELNDYAGYVDVACYYGSSTYNQKEMARLLDEVIADAKALGIETATPEQLAEMKALWGAENV